MSLCYLKTQTKTPAQAKNWASYDQLQAIQKTMKQDLKTREVLERDEDEGLTRKEYDDLQKYIIFRTYLKFPVRNDFAHCIVIKQKAYDKLSEEEKKADNFLVTYNRGRRKFHINSFKNSRRVGSKVFEIPLDLNKEITHFLKFNKSGYFVTLSDRTTPISPNSLGALLIRISREYLGKRISSSMLRHIIISHANKGKPTILQKEADEKKIEDTYLHSGMMNDLYTKKD